MSLNKLPQINRSGADKSGLRGSLCLFSCALDGLNLGQLLNGKHVFDQVQQSLRKYGPLQTPHELVRQLYLTAFSRYPSATESKSTAAFLAASDNRDDAIRDLIWAIVNTQEFMFQH